jgi:AcrR family transcriptional regulator
MAHTSEERRRRPGGRSARVRAAVLEATLAELAAGGSSPLSFEGVARRAGVNKTTLYRRWGTRENLILDAMLELGRERVPIPDTGSLRQDLVEYGAAIVRSNAIPEVEAVVRAVVAMGQSEPNVAEASRRFWSARLELAGQIVERAIARGELPPRTDAGLVVEAVVAAIYFRLLMSGQTLDTTFVAAVADLVTAGAARR